MNEPNSIEAGAVHVYVVEYEQGRDRYHTMIEAGDMEAAKRQFRRDNPLAEMLSCEVN